MLEVVVWLDPVRDDGSWGTDVAGVVGRGRSGDKIVLVATCACAGAVGVSDADVAVDVAEGAAVDKVHHEVVSRVKNLNFRR